MKHDDVKGKSEAELKDMARTLEEEIFTLRLQHGAGQLKQTADIRKARRRLARALTALRLMELDKAGKEAS